MQLFFEEEGSGDPVVFLHGIAAHRGTWRDQAIRLSQAPRDEQLPSYRCIRPDLRGHGQSKELHRHDSAPWTLDELATDVAELLRGQTDRPAHVVGHSAGGVIAMCLTLSHPQLVRSLVLVGTSAECNARAANEFYLHWAGLAESEGMARVFRAMGMRADADPGRSPDPLGFARFARAIATLHPAPIAPRLAEIHQPTLVIVGEKDPFGVGGSVKISRAIQNSQLVVLPTLGHLPFLDDAPGFQLRLRRHFSAS